MKPRAQEDEGDQNFSNATFLAAQASKERRDAIAAMIFAARLPAGPHVSKVSMAEGAKVAVEAADVLLRALDREEG